MKSTRLPSISLRAALALIVFVMVTVSAVAERDLFAMDTGTRDANHKTYTEQAAMVKELDYSGIGFSGCVGIPDMLAAVDSHGLELSTIYTGLEIKGDNIVQDGMLESAIGELAGRETTVWLYLGGKRPGDPTAADAPVVEKLRALADHAAKSKVRIALYPHADAYADRVDDCVRIAKKVDRKNFGVTFNLCHWLKVDGNDLEVRLKQALPHLFVVTVNGADSDGNSWDTLIQTLDRGSFDVARLMRPLDKLGFTGPVGLQHYGIRGDARENLARSMVGWRLLQSRLAAEPVQLIPSGVLGAFRDRGDWTAVTDLRLDPEIPKRLIGELPCPATSSRPARSCCRATTARSFSATSGSPNSKNEARLCAVDL